jgi:hypothetical protein
MSIKMESTYIPSEDIVAREIEGELIIVPLVSGIGDLDDELFTLNETGKAIWDKLDGTNSLAQIIISLRETYNAQADAIEQDVVGLVEELVRRRILVESKTI